MARGVVLRLRKGPAVIALTLVHEVGKLRIGLAEDERPVVRDVYLPQRLDDEGVAHHAAFPPFCVHALVVQGLRHARQIFQHGSRFFQSLHDTGVGAVLSAGRALAGVQIFHLLRQHGAQGVGGFPETFLSLGRSLLFLPHPVFSLPFVLSLAKGYHAFLRRRSTYFLPSSSYFTAYFIP